MPEIDESRTAIEKASFEDPTISDFRKETRTFPVLCRGVSAADTEEVCSAIMFDLFAGKMDSNTAAGMFKGVDLMLKRDEQNLKREELALQAELRSRRNRSLEAGRELLEMEREIASPARRKRRK